MLVIDPGDTVVVWTRDVSDNQIGPDSDTSVIAGLDWDRVYPLERTDRRRRRRARRHAGRSRSSTSTPRAGAGRRSCPGLGLLPDDFPDPYLRVFDLSHGDVAYMREDIAIPLEPFFGTMGVCPAGASAQPVMPPGTFGGNMDIRQLVARRHAVPARPGRPGAVLVRRRARRPGRRRGLRHRPRGADVRVAALHARQGPLDPGRLSTARPAPLTRRVDSAPFYATTGVGGDLYVAAQDAIRAMVDHLASNYDLGREDAYLLCSLAVDLKISEIVDAGQYIVSALLPEAVFSR